jgi:RNA polymerase sigma factor (sigma-70 family)
MGMRLDVLLSHLRDVGATSEPGLLDAHLLARFAQTGDEAAFTALLRRHGPMVLGVCRRVLLDSHDAEDAFQATFLVLVRKAPTLLSCDALGPWLYTVAHRTSLRARADCARRRAHERRAAASAREETPLAEPRHGLNEVLDDEVRRLPAKYRAPLVLCYLQGRTYEEAARQLRCPKGTVAVRLARARVRLRRRLQGRGVTAATALESCAAGTHLSALLVASTARAAARLGSGVPSAVAVSARVAGWAEAGARVTGLGKAKVAAGLCVALGLLTGSVVIAWHGRDAAGGLAATPRAAARPGEALPIDSLARPEERTLIEAPRPGAPWVVASGRRARRDLGAGNFDTLDVDFPIDVEVSLGGRPTAVLSADDNLVESVEVSAEGPALRARLDRAKNYELRGKLWKLTLATSQLRALRLSRSARVTVRGPVTGDLDVRVDHDAELRATLTGGDVVVAAAGGGRVILDGRARTLKARATHSGVLALEGLTALREAELELNEHARAAVCATGLRTFRVKLDNSAALTGKLEAATTEVDADGNSKVALAGSGGQTRLEARNESELRLTDFRVTSAAVTLRSEAVAVVDVSSDGPFTATLNRESVLEGRVRADHIDLDAQRASRVGLRGSARSLRLKARAGCRLDLGALAVDRAGAELEDRCAAVLSPRLSLDYELSRSTLGYYHHPANGGAVALDKSSSAPLGP